MAMAFATPDDWREDEEEDWTIPAEPKRRRILGRGRLVCAVLGSLSIAFVVVTRHAEQSIAPAPVPVAAPDWVTVPEAKNPFLLRSDLFDGQPLVHTHLRRSNGDGSEDILASGGLDAAQPYLRMTIGRADAGPPAATLYLELALQGTESGLSILHADQPFLLSTRFGVFETAQMTVASGAAAVGCLGFRSSAADGRMHIDGLACGAGTKVLTGAVVACVIDGLTLTEDAQDTMLVDYFRAASSTPQGGCALAHTPPSRSDADPTNAPSKANVKLRIQRKSHEAT
jgi:hypothetical protein